MITGLENPFKQRYDTDHNRTTISIEGSGGVYDPDGPIGLDEEMNRRLFFG